MNKYFHDHGLTSDPNFMVDLEQLKRGNMYGLKGNEPTVETLEGGSNASPYKQHKNLKYESKMNELRASANKRDQQREHGSPNSRSQAHLGSSGNSPDRSHLRTSTSALTFEQTKQMLLKRQQKN